MFALCAACGWKKSRYRWVTQIFGSRTKSDYTQYGGGANDALRGFFTGCRSDKYLATDDNESLTTWEGSRLPRLGWSSLYAVITILCAEVIRRSFDWSALCIAESDRCDPHQWIFPLAHSRFTLQSDPPRCPWCSSWSRWWCSYAITRTCL